MQGSHIGGYTILSKLGEGGMGTVYLAEHTLIGRKAAIKTLLPRYTSNPDMVRRFINEAKAASAVRHPGIVEIYDSGRCDDGTAYIAMELLEGESLHQRLRSRARLSINEAMAIAGQIVAGLSAAHAKGIIHRDLKPDNIFIVPDPEIGERVKILDFGIAKLTSDTDGSSKTRTGVIMGTPDYMAPEQCRGSGHVDYRADYYALGCMLFRMLCGRPPFIGEGSGSVLGAHIYEPAPRPSKLEPSIPAKVDDLILRLLAKDREERPSSEAEIAAMFPSPREPSISGLPAPGVAGRYTAEVSTTLNAAPGTITAPPRARRSRTARLLVAGLIASLAGLGLLFGGSSDDAPATERAGAATAGAGIPVTPGAGPDAALAAPSAENDSAEPAAVRARITIKLASTPSGAEVIRQSDGALLGRTPFEQELDAGKGELLLVLKKADYRDQLVAIATDRSDERMVELVPARGSGADSTPSASSPGRSPSAGRTPDGSSGTESRTKTTPKTKTKTKTKTETKTETKIDPSDIQAGEAVDPF